ncbi:hypothetical protein ACE1SV_67030 [Streptomyces sennicomposti]
MGRGTRDGLGLVFAGRARQARNGDTPSVALDDRPDDRAGPAPLLSRPRHGGGRASPWRVVVPAAVAPLTG